VDGIRPSVGLLVVSGADMSNRRYLDLPRNAWQTPLSGQSAVVAMVVSTGGEARRSRSTEESSRSASAEDDEAEPSMGPEVRAACVPVPVCLLAPLGGGGT
jgi:hypothetical protein